MENLTQLSYGVNILWTLIGAALVFFMQAGFAMVETGFTRAKNAGNIIMKNLMDFSIGTVVFWFIGFGIMQSAGNGFIGGMDLFIKRIYRFYNGNISNSFLRNISNNCIRRNG